WDANRGASQNHFMLGNIVEWFYADLVGIRPEPKSPGFRRVIVAPSPVGNLTSAGASYESVRGDIRVNWKRDGKRFELVVEIPANVEATVLMPTSESGNVLEGGGDISGSKGAHLVKREGGRAEIEIGSGQYYFESTLP